jgi:hypothetical protein
LKWRLHGAYLAIENDVSDNGHDDNVQEETDGELPERSQIAFGFIIHVWK